MTSGRLRTEAIEELALVYQTDAITAKTNMGRNIDRGPWEFRR